MSLTTSAGLSFRDLVFSDLMRYRSDEEQTWWGVIKRSLSTPGILASLLLRAQQISVRKGNDSAAAILRSTAMVLVGADFVPGVDVGPGLFMPHPSGVVLGNGVVIGANVTFGVGVTAGVRNPGAADTYPVICDGAIVLSHAVLAGPVRIGSHAQVGANSVVLSDVPDRAIVFGMPAEQVGSREGRVPGVADGPSEAPELGEADLDQ